MDALYNMIFYKWRLGRGSGQPLTKKNNDDIKKSNKKKLIKKTFKNKKLIAKNINGPDVININDVDPVTDSAPRNLDAELEQNIRNAEIERNNINHMDIERDIQEDPFRYIDRGLVLNHIAKLKKDHEFKQNLALKVGETFAKEDFYTELLGLKDQQDQMAKNAAELNKLKMEIIQLNKNINEEKNKGTPIKKNNTDLWKKEIEQKNKYFEMQTQIKELKEREKQLMEENRKIAKEEETLKNKYEKAIQKGDLRHITSSFNIEKMHLNKKINLLENKLNSDSKILENYKTNNIHLKETINNLKSEKDYILNLYKQNENKIQQIKDEFEKKISDKEMQNRQNYEAADEYINTLENEFKQKEEIFNFQLSEYEKQNKELINDIKKYMVKSMFLKMLLESKKLNKKQYSSIKKDLSEPWFHTPEDSGQKSSKKSSSSSSDNDDGGGGEINKPKQKTKKNISKFTEFKEKEEMIEEKGDSDDDDDNQPGKIKIKQKTKKSDSNIEIENKNDNDDDSDYDYNVEVELKNLLNTYNIKKNKKVINDFIKYLNGYIVDLKNDGKETLKRMIQLYDEKKQENEKIRKDLEETNKKNYEISKQNTKIKKENEELERQKKINEEINQERNRQYQIDLETNKKILIDEFNKKFDEEFKNQIEKYKSELKNQYENAINDIKKSYSDMSEQEKKKDVIMLNDVKNSQLEILWELEKYKLKEMEYIKNQENLNLIIEELKNNDELTKKEKENIEKDKKELEKRKNELEEEYYNYKQEIQNKLEELDYMDGKVRYFEDAMNRELQEKEINKMNSEQLINYYKKEQDENKNQIKILNDQIEEIHNKYEDYFNASQAEKNQLIINWDIQKNDIVRQAWETINDLKWTLQDREKYIIELQENIKNKWAEKITKEEYINNIKDEEYKKYKLQIKPRKENKNYMEQKEKEYNEQREREIIREETIKFNKKDKEIWREAERCNKKLLKIFKDKASPEKLAFLQNYARNYMSVKNDASQRGHGFADPDFNVDPQKQQISDFGYNPYASPIKPFNNYPSISAFNQHVSNFMDEKPDIRPQAKKLDSHYHSFDFDSIGQVPMKKSGTKSFFNPRK